MSSVSCICFSVLGVEQNASGDEIKKAYRKLALKLHPDKNLDEDPEVAKAVFQELQQAFEVLSDQQERAWYDRHRDAILSGSDGAEAGHGIDLFPFFTSSCYSGFEGPDGFYEVYNDLFVNVASEEDEGDDWPKFGDENSPEDNWQSFYAFWSGYSTTKSFSWLDKYDTRQADNRRILRAMEKENKKVKDAAKKDRNDLVRSLVAFVRKRDPRVKAHNQMLEAKREENKRKTAENRKKKLAEQAKQQEEAAEAYKKSTFGMKSMEDELQMLEDRLDAEEEDNLFCVACNKELRNEKAFATHRTQKKHLENVEKLKELLQDDEDLLNSTDEEEEVEDALDVPAEEPEPEPVKEATPSKAKTPAPKSKKKRRKGNSNNVAHQTGAVDVVDQLTCQVCKSSFPSKNKLFSHLKETKHAVRL